MLHGSALRGEETCSPLETLRDQEIRLIQEALQRTGWNKRQAARLLGINRSTLYSKLRRYGIHRRLAGVDSTTQES